MRIFFIGTVESSYVALETLVNMQSNVAGVLTCDKSDFNSDFKSLKPLCEQFQIKYKTCTGKLRKEDIDFIKNCQPDVLFCIGWSYLLPTEVLNIPKFGCIGFHPAPLPVGRGRHPIIWSLLLGLEQTASCFFMLEDGADTGAIVSEEIILINSNETAKTLMGKVLQKIPKQIEQVVNNLQHGQLPKKIQNELLATNWRKRKKSDGRIDFRMSVLAIERLIRALAEPYPCAHIEYKGNDYNVLACENCRQYTHHHEPGKILCVEKDTLTVACFDGDVSFVNRHLAKCVTQGEYFI